MNITKLATIAAVAFALATGAALAKPSMYPQTSAQVNFDLANPNGITYVPAHK